MTRIVLSAAVISVFLVGSLGLGAAPAGRYVVSPETVLDTVSGRTWQRSPPNTTVNWAAAGAYCQGLVLGGAGGWRLPSVKELQSIVDVGSFSPAIDAIAFPNTPATFFWTGTLAAGVTGSAWTVEFTNGETNRFGTAPTCSVRCVR